MTIILDILKFFIVLVYVFFVLDAVLNFKYEILDEKKGFWLDWVYMAYSCINLVLIIKLLHG